MKYVVVSGGVLSGLGKGITAASIGFLLKSCGVRVTAMKCDMYLNIDAGTMNPLEHGEVFVTHDGLETDQDLGHYERFIGKTLTRLNYVTNGQLYKMVLDKERALEYDGKCVQPYHHIPPEIIRSWKLAGEKNNSQVVIVELGGTVGEYEGLLFFEAVRRLKLKDPKSTVLVHVGYLPVPGSIGELKSKPIQQSITNLNSLGLEPDIVVCRAEKKVDKIRKEKIALASGLLTSDIISNPDLESVYQVPLFLQNEGIHKKIAKKLRLKLHDQNIQSWRKMVEKILTLKDKVDVAVVGKYQKTGDYTLEDAYVCVVEALKHSGVVNGVKVEVSWIDSEKLEKLKDSEVGGILKKYQGIIVPQGWGKRGVEGKIKAVNFARVNKIPYLGLCFGMQMAVIEYARNVLNLKNANTQEVDPKTRYPVIHIMDNQKQFLKNKQYGGTIRLGAWPCQIKTGTIIENAYKKYGGSLNNPWYERNNNIFSSAQPKKAALVYERHRHRYEFNNKYKKRFEEKGFVISGTSPDGMLVEAIELKDHPFFVGTQFHPEYESRPLTPHPIFVSFVEAVKKRGVPA